MSACVSSYNYNNEMSSVYDKLAEANSLIGNQKTDLKTVYDILKEMDLIVSKMIVPEYVEEKPAISVVPPLKEEVVEPKPTKPVAKKVPKVRTMEEVDIQSAEIYEKRMKTLKEKKEKKEIEPVPKKAPVCLINTSEDPAVILPPKKITKENPWIKFLQEYSAGHQIPYHQTLHLPNIKELYREWKLNSTPKINGIIGLTTAGYPAPAPVEVSVPAPVAGFTPIVSVAPIAKPEGFHHTKTLQAVKGIIIHPTEEGLDYDDVIDPKLWGQETKTDPKTGKKKCVALFFSKEALEKAIEYNKYNERGISPYQGFSSYMIGSLVPFKYQWF